MNVWRAYLFFIPVHLDLGKLSRVAEWRKVKERCLMSCCLGLTVVLTKEDAHCVCFTAEYRRSSERFSDRVKASQTEESMKDQNS